MSSTVPKEGRRAADNSSIPYCGAQCKRDDAMQHGQNALCWQGVIWSECLHQTDANRGAEYA